MARPRPIADRLAASIDHASAAAADAEISRLRGELAAMRGRYKAALAQIDAERERANAIGGLTEIEARPPKKRPAGKAAAKGSATVILALSDWHIEERVDPETVNGLNAFDLDVAEKRIDELCERFSTLLEHERRLVPVDRVVVWLGGDHISGHIHPDTAEMAQLAPLEATRLAGRYARGIIDMVAGMAREVIVSTNSGNHGRSTDKLRIGTELDHSFEQHLYLTMAAAETRKNVTWQVGRGYLNVVDLDGFRVRFHHGHAIRYAGGVGGITIPANKAIAAWDKIHPADLTVFGHYHQFSWLRAGRYVSNGSLIGHSAYATRIKATYEPPCQAMIVVDHGRREVTKALPIFCDGDLQQAKT